MITLAILALCALVVAGVLGLFVAIKNSSFEEGER